MPYRSASQPAIGAPTTYATADNRDDRRSNGGRTPDSPDDVENDEALQTREAELPECVHHAEDAQARVPVVAAHEATPADTEGPRSPAAGFEPEDRQQGERRRGERRLRRSGTGAAARGRETDHPLATPRRDRHRARLPVRIARVRRAVAAGGRRRGPGTVGSGRSSRRRTRSTVTAATAVEVLNGRTASPVHASGAPAMTKGSRRPYGEAGNRSESAPEASGTTSASAPFSADQRAYGGRRMDEMDQDHRPVRREHRDCEGEAEGRQAQQHQ